MSTYTFTLKDQNGGEHEYETKPFPGLSGLTHLLKLSSLGLKPIITLLSEIPEAVKDVPEAAPDIEVSRKEAVAKVVGDMDFSSLISSLSSIESFLQDENTAKYLSSLLAHTTRDGFPLYSAKDSIVFDVAYQENAVEAVWAIWQVCKVNNFLDYQRILSTEALSQTPVKKLAQ